MLTANSKKFWRCWKGCFRSTVNNNINVNNLKDDLDIANYLATNFQSACTPNNVIKQREFKDRYVLNKSNYCGNQSEQFSIDVEMVGKAIQCIDFNKAAGFDRLSIEHIAYAHPCIVVILCKLFNMLLYTGLVPDDFSVGVTTPIPKFKGCKKTTNADDFRGITICPVISKIFEHCLMNNFC